MKIGVVGLGLIGGSIFKRLLKNGLDVVGVSASQQGENISAEYSILSDCEAVFVCSPMNAVAEVLSRVEDFVSPSTVVTDVCSLKGFLADKKFKFDFIPSHPMAGTEFSGWDNSFDTMFEGAKWVITPISDNSNVELLEVLVKSMGAIPVYTTPLKHDEAVAMISHVPMILSQALFKTAQVNDLAMKLASSGFRDSTRLAGSNSVMANDMVNLNSKNIQQTLLKLYATVGDLLSDYSLENLSDIAEARRKMYKDGKNIL